LAAPRGGRRYRAFEPCVWERVNGPGDSHLRRNGRIVEWHSEHRRAATREDALRYVEFRDAICRELGRSVNGLTWSELRERLDLPYRTPCPEWVRRMEKEDGLVRTAGSGRAHVWWIDEGGTGG